MARPRTRLVAVTATDPCPLCDGDHKCSVTEDGNFHLCGRKTGGVEGFAYLGQAKGDPQFGQYCPVDRRPAPRTDVPVPSPPGDWDLRAADYQRALTPALEQELAGSLGLPAGVLRKFGLGYMPRLSRWALPEKDATGEVIGINQRFHDGSKRMIEGGARALSYAEDWDRTGGPVLCPEGVTDTVTLVAMGLCAVGRPSSTGGVESLAAMLARVPADRPIIVLGENDQKPNGDWPGRDGAFATAEKLARELNREILVAFPPPPAKDVRAWFQAQGPDLEDQDELGKLGRRWVRPKFDVKPLRSSLRRRQGIPTDPPSTRTDPIAPAYSSTPVSSAPPPHHPPSTSSPSHTAAA